jgi:class 3 adenylate cyclase
LATATDDVLEGTITVLFTDVEGSTEMRNQRGDDAAGSILRAHEELVREQLEAHSGRAVKALGDGFMVAFTSARKAVSCAVAIQRAVHEYNHQHPDREVHVRIGLNSGEVSQSDGDLYGAAVNAAARVAAKAVGDQIMVSGVVKQLAGKVPDAEFVDRGRFRLKGFEDRWQLFEVTWEHDHSEPAPVVLTGHVRTPLVGRADTLKELYACLEATGAGEGGMVMVGGEPGVGKTRVCDEVLSEARRRGFLTLVGHCYESEGSPYIPFVEMVESAMRQVEPDVLRAHLGDGAGEVARLAPELRKRFPDIPPALELPPEQERRHLYNSCRDFIGRAAAAYPICVLLDDLHWADEGSLLLLERFAQDVAGLRVLVLGTYRDVELDLGRPLARTLDGLVRQRLVRRMSIKRLAEHDVGGMLEALGGKGAPQPLVDAIYGETEGNPFFVEEVFKHLSESGQLFDAGGSWRADLAVGELDVPESVRLVLGRRLERLSEDARRALSSAAVIGRSFDFTLIAAMGGGLSEDALLDALDEGERAGLVTSTADGTDVRFTFGHELIRQTLLTGLTTLRRQRIHLKLADTMEQLYADSVEEHAGDIAGHLLQAGVTADAAKVARFLAIAGDRAMDASAFEEALRSFESGLAVQPKEDRAGWARLRAGEGGAYRALGRWEESEAAWNEAIDIYEALGDREVVGKLCVEQALQLAWAFRYEEALLVAGRGLVAVGEEPSLDRMTLLSLSGVTLSISGNHAAADEMTAEALEMARGLKDNAALSFALGVRAVHHWAYLELAEAVRLGTEALRRAAEFSVWRQADVGPFTAMALHFLGRDEQATAVLDEVEPVAEKVGHRQSLALCFRVRNFIAARGPGFPDEQLRFVANDHERIAGLLGGSWAADSEAQAAMAHFWAGDWTRARDHANKSLGAGFYWVWNPAYPAIQMLIAAYDGDIDAVMTTFKTVENDRPVPGQPATVGAWSAYVNVVEALILVGETEKAAALRPILQHVIDVGAVSLGYTFRLVQLAAGLAAWADGDPAAAEAHLAQAEADATMRRDEVQAVDIKRFRAMMLLDGRSEVDGGAARELLETAASDYQRIGMPRHVAMVREMLGRA